MKRLTFKNGQEWRGERVKREQNSQVGKNSRKEEKEYRRGEKVEVGRKSRER